MKNIRNFSIIAHIDHGKSTLADRFLEITNTIPKDKMKSQFLDMMDLEREKGITIKMQPARMSYILNSKSYILNLIDTPGHVDFSYEVSRSMAAVEGAILLVDATKGIQAQTLANLAEAQKQNLKIVAVLNKIDRPEARIEETKTEIINLLKIPAEEIFSISARQGTNVPRLLDIIIEKFSPPSSDNEKPLRALIFDSKFDPFKGIIAYVRVVDGSIKTNEGIYLMASETEGKAKEVGYFVPELKPAAEITAGEIGYIATGIKEPGKVRVGDTITTVQLLNAAKVEPLQGYREVKPMVFASIFPEDPNEFDLLKDALLKLRLNDASLTFEPETKEILGRGFRCGFLGSLHAEIVTERLKREYDLDLIISSPSVVFKITSQKNKGQLVYSPSDWPELSDIETIEEPWASLEIITPLSYLGPVSDVLKTMESNYVGTEYFGQERVFLLYELPLREIIVGFYDKLKSVSQGYASMNYKVLGYRLADLVKLEILVAGKKEEAFSRIVPRDKAAEAGKKIVGKLKDTLPPQMFSVALQAVISGKIIARETISAHRKDVIAPLYGGDYSRKRKLLEKQKKGKKELKQKSQIKISPKVYLDMFK